MNNLLLILKKIHYSMIYGNFFLRIKIFLSSQYQKKIFLPLFYLFKNNNYAKLDYSSGFQKKSLNSFNKSSLNKLIKFYHSNLKNKKEIHGIWNENLKIKFNKFTSALLSKDKSKLNKIFNNMFRLPISEGLCVGYEDFRSYKNLFHKIYIKYQFNNYLKELKKNKVNLRMLQFENIGNPAGVVFKKNIFSIDTLRHANQAFTIAELTSNIKEPKILEIGGGLGGTCYQYNYSFNNNKKIKYYLVDILEVLILAGYFLHKKPGLIFPNNYTKKNKSAKKKIFLIPKNNLNLLKNIKFDLVFNSCSLGEMDKKDCYNYEKIIDFHTKKNSIFYHINHDLKISYKNKDNISVNKLGSEIMSGFKKFKLINKFKRRNNLLEDKSIEYNEFIYKKISS
jgi:putative sugar O-methyltransferase